MIPLNNNQNVNNTTPAKNTSYYMEYYIELIFDKFSKGLRIIGPIFAFALTLFVLIVTHAFFQIILPYWIKHSGLVIGLFLTLMALYLLFSILFNYFLAVLVRPGSIEDILKSKFYRKVDPFSLSNSAINLKNVFLNKNNIKDDKTKEKVEVKIRLKADTRNDTNDNILKENEILKNANNSLNLDNNNLNKYEYINDSLTEDQIFQKHLEDRLSKIPKEVTDEKPNNDTDNLIQNKSQENEINEYYGFTNNSSDNSLPDIPIHNNEIPDCKYCKLPKVIRAHHCTICGYCVFKMDHHCPWINNCVGQNNHRYFVLFLTHLMFGCLFVCITAIPLVFNSKVVKSTEFNFVSVLSFVGFLLMIFFNSWNWFLVIRGNTTIEYWSLKANFSRGVIKDFSLLNWRENIFLVFGTQSLAKAIFIPSITKLPFSGLEWTKMSCSSFTLDVIDYNKKGEEIRISPVDNEI